MGAGAPDTQIAKGRRAAGIGCGGGDALERSSAGGNGDGHGNVACWGSVFSYLDDRLRHWIEYFTIQGRDGRVGGDRNWTTTPHRGGDKCQWRALQSCSSGRGRLLAQLRAEHALYRSEPV
jgi:hypothetical protein